MAHLKSFFAVTRNTLYLVSTEEDVNGAPTVRKLAERHRNPNLAPSDLLSKFGKRSHVAVTQDGIFLFDSVDRKSIEEFKGNGFGTTPLIGLFFREEDVQQCMEDGDADFSKYRLFTKEVAEAIGSDHPVFILSKRDGLRL